MVGVGLYPYQAEGVTWLQARNHALLADEMGLGKTRQAIMAMSGRVVIVCPAVCKSVWAREIAALRTDLIVNVLRKRADLLADVDVNILNYELLSENLLSSCIIAPITPNGKRTEPPIDTLIADEAHALSSNKSLRTQRFRDLARYSKRIWLLTGTPMLNNPLGLWSVLVSGKLHRTAFDDFEQFTYLFGGKKGAFALEWGKPRPEAATHMDRVMLRRRRADVLPDLPTKTHQVIEVELPAKIIKQHDAALREIPLDMLPGDIGRFAELRRLTALAKMAAVTELVEQYEASETPVIVASAHTEPVQALGNRPGWAFIDGSVSDKNREQIVNDFQRGDKKYLAINIRAGGVGITLTNANHMIFVDQEWTPALNSQCEDRICRIGQTRPCNIIHLVGNTRLEERVWSILNDKKTNQTIVGV